MTRFLLAVAILSCAITPLALVADLPENSSAAQPASASLNGVYVKMLLPDAPAAPAVQGDSIVESWIFQSIDKEQRQANHRAVTGWVRVVNEPFEGTPVWPGGVLDGVSLCHVGADLYERKDGQIKIEFHGWTPVGPIIKVALPDEPGSRVVVPVTQAKFKHGIPHIAIFVGVPDK